jgi:hypothetical protein
MKCCYTAMTNLDTIIIAIQTLKPISFEYNKPGKVSGKRIGNPHAIFILTSKIQEKSTKIHLVQASGASDSKEKNPFPDFRMFNIEDLSNVSLLQEEANFEPYHEKYNPEWDGYKDVIEKI